MSAESYWSFFSITQKPPISRHKYKSMPKSFKTTRGFQDPELCPNVPWQQSIHLDSQTKHTHTLTQTKSGRTTRRGFPICVMLLRRVVVRWSRLEEEGVEGQCEKSTDRLFFTKDAILLDPLISTLTRLMHVPLRLLHVPLRLFHPTVCFIFDVLTSLVCVCESLFLNLTQPEGFK